MEALAVQLTQREGELIQEKAEVKKLASFLKQVKHAYARSQVVFLSLYVFVLQIPVAIIFF